MNDMTYLLFYLTFFILLSITVPLINAEFDTDTSSDSNGDLLDVSEKDSSLTIWKIIGNLFLIPFWTFGFPIWINFSILLIFRIHMIILISRFIWIGGGG